MESVNVTVMDEAQTFVVTIETPSDCASTTVEAVQESVVVAIDENVEITVEPSNLEESVLVEIDESTEDNTILVENFTEAILVEVGDGVAGEAAETYETINRNLKANDATFFYTVDSDIDYIEYNTPGGTITKTFNYDVDSNITSVVLSGDLPGGVDTTKSFSYTGEDISNIAYT